MTPSDVQLYINDLNQKLEAVQTQLAEFGEQTSAALAAASQAAPVITHGNFLIDALTVLILAAFVGYYVIWNVTPALHAPLMGITNAISSVIIVGALIAAGPEQSSFSKWLGFAGIILASVNIFGGFVVTNRMLEMFRSKKK